MTIGVLLCMLRGRLYFGSDAMMIVMCCWSLKKVCDDLQILNCHAIVFPEAERAASCMTKYFQEAVLEYNLDRDHGVFRNKKYKGLVYSLFRDQKLADGEGALKDRLRNAIAEVEGWFNSDELSEIYAEIDAIFPKSVGRPGSPMKRFCNMAVIGQRLSCCPLLCGQIVRTEQVLTECLNYFAAVCVSCRRRYWSAVHRIREYGHGD
jgi:hypothetical protein